MQRAELPDTSDKLDRDIQDPQWAWDNSGVFFQYNEQGDTKIGFYSVDGAFKKIADHVASTVSAYGGGSYSLSRTGLIATVYGRPDNPGDVAIYNMGAMKVLTSVNQELLAQKKPGHVEEIWYESSKDKRKIQGWIIHPPTRGCPPSSRRLDRSPPKSAEPITRRESQPTCV
jgi:acylaminoacyl-peptidase